MIERRRAVLGALAIALLAALIGYAAAEVSHYGLPLYRFGALRLPGGSGGPTWESLQQVRRHLAEDYLESVPEQQIIVGALEGMVRSTGDPYSAFFTPERYRRFREQFHESFGGVGVAIEHKDGAITVIRLLKGTPGERAGLRPGDRIVGVNGADITHMSIEEAVQLIRGPAGSAVTLTVQREGLAQPLDITLVRAVIETPAVEYRMLERPIGYIQVVDFTTNVHKKVAQALDDLRAQGLTALVLDLRRNPGGLLSEAVDVASLFLPPGPVVHIVQKNGRRETINTRGQRNFTGPIVVLIDDGSASAAEIVAGALKDRNAATLVGARSFGKGSVQSFFDLSGGAGLKLTTARYLTAGGHSIHGRGIDPDLVVEAPAAAMDLDDPQHPQLRRAIEILRGLERQRG